MNLLKKVWFRLLISFLGAGIIAEIIHISTGDPNRPLKTNLTVVYGIVIYIFLTLFSKNIDKKVI